jgi:hypothetical protein
VTSTQWSKLRRGLVVIAIVAIAVLCMASTLLALVVGAITSVAVVVDVLVCRTTPIDSTAPGPEVFTVDLEHRIRGRR